jgi:hypothetical protein
MSAAHLDRRCFLKSGGSLVVAFSLRIGVAAAADFSPVPANQLDSWIAIVDDGKVTAFTGRIDMGTGTQTVTARRSPRNLTSRCRAYRS